MARERTVMEVIGDAAYIYGGGGDANDAAYNDTWKGEALPIWTQLTVSRPFGRILSGMVAIDSSHMWLFGGFAFDSQMQAVAFSDTLAADVSLVPIVSLTTVSTQVLYTFNLHCGFMSFVHNDDL
ncbi:hypothetical protein DYB30_005786 [Aphanomyces astaci]|uniref:Uncharacterized protein n=1 Tax=Aphanomyces astaci TaxID=112090 RepID=A0A397D4Z4_APHAT|nr:hypothetical protein DYB30_005786 [Aphanomyces astaci]